MGFTAIITGIFIFANVLLIERNYRELKAQEEMGDKEEETVKDELEEAKKRKRNSVDGIKKEERRK